MSPEPPPASAKSYAEQLARAGAALVLVARRADRIEALARTLRHDHGAEVEVLAADLSTPQGVAAVVVRLSTDPEIDGLVNNAGYAARGRVADLDGDALEEMLRVNVVALSRLSQAALQAMTTRGPGGNHQHRLRYRVHADPGSAGCGASKNYVIGFTRTMQVEAEGSGVQVQLLVPGVIATDSHQIAGNSLSNFPPERVMHPDELVAASLRTIQIGEPVCIPSLPDIRDWEAFVTAERAAAANASRDRAADRYQLDQ